MIIKPLDPYLVKLLSTFTPDRSKFHTFDHYAVTRAVNKGEEQNYVRFALFSASAVDKNNTTIYTNISFIVPVDYRITSSSKEYYSILKADNVPFQFSKVQLQTTVNYIKEGSSCSKQMLPKNYNLVEFIT